MNDDERSIYERWAVLRFGVVGPLLAAPPPPGTLQELALKKWEHPGTGEPVSFGTSTIERWYYKSKYAPNPVRMLRRKVRKDKGEHHLSEAQQRELRQQYSDHPSWSCKLHHDNLVVVARTKGLGVVPSYATVRRFMKSHGLVKQRRRGKEGSRAERQHASHEKRSVGHHPPHQAALHDRLRGAVAQRLGVLVPVPLHVAREPRVVVHWGTSTSTSARAPS